MFECQLAMFECQTVSASAYNPSEVKLLIVDDDDLYRVTIGTELEKMGFSVEGFADGETLMAKLRAGSGGDVIVLDWETHTTYGIDLIPQLRERGVATPIVFHTAHNSPAHEKLAFSRGADDFVDKTRGIEVLATRLRRVVAYKDRRPYPLPAPSHLRKGKLALKLDVKRAYWDDRDLGLTLTEYKILHLLVTNAGNWVAYRHVYDTMHHEGFVAGSGDEGYRANVRSSIKRIRNKFRGLDSRFSQIKTFTGFGYCWEASAT